MKVSVIMPLTREAEAQRAIQAIRAQQTAHQVELITVGANAQIVVEDPNPALRRNAAARSATGEVLAFIDDDAFASTGWIQTAMSYLETNPDVIAVGGPDPAPADSTTGQLFAETLLATPWIGSGVLCHENRSGIHAVKRPNDVALVNLFVRRDTFDQAGGFDERIGYVGEDTALIEKLMKLGRVVYHSGVVVHHQRRFFPRAYLAQRWRYRLKTGRMLASGAAAYRRDPRVWALLAAPVAFLALLILNPPIAVVALTFYLAACLALAVTVTRLPVHWWPAIPLAFLAHHTVYFFATVTGMFTWRRA
jgi:glycosyltransferase involved in cell wall biosynthesis